jgi:hypothetical protein
MLARKGQRVVAIEVTLDHWALRRTRREGGAEAWSVLPIGQAGVTASLPQASRSLRPERFARLPGSPCRGAWRPCMGFSVPKHGESRPRKAAIRWLVTASDFGGFERALYGRLRVSDVRYRQIAKIPNENRLPETPHRHAQKRNRSLPRFNSCRRQRNSVAGRHFAELFFKPMSVRSAY